VSMVACRRPSSPSTLATVDASGIATAKCAPEHKYIPTLGWGDGSPPATRLRSYRAEAHEKAPKRPQIREHQMRNRNAHPFPPVIEPWPAPERKNEPSKASLQQ
jgi:hypothetical protein